MRRDRLQSKSLDFDPAPWRRIFQCPKTRNRRFRGIYGNYASRENVVELLTLYAIENKSHFAAGAEPTSRKVDANFVVRASLVAFTSQPFGSVPLIVKS
jgi:hypothetical protein